MIISKHIAKTYSIRFKVLFSIFIIAILFQIFFTTFINTYIANLLTAYEFKNGISSSTETVKSISFLMDSVDSTSELLAINSDVLQAVKSENSIEYKYSMKKMLDNITTLNNHISGVSIISTDGIIFSSYEDISQFDISNDLYTILDDYSVHYSKPYTRIKEDRSTYVISSYRKIYASNKKLLGFVVLDLEYDYLTNLFTALSSKNSEKVMLINNNGDIIFHYPKYISLESILENHPDLIGNTDFSIEKEIFNMPSLVITNTIEKSDWKLIRIISKQQIHKDTIKLKTVMYFLTSMLIVLAFIFSLYLSKKITKPILELNDKMQKVRSGDLNIQKKSKTNATDELQKLNATFDDMVDQLNEKIQHEFELQKNKSELEFEILQNQINPHFLYNTLDSVKWLAVLQDSDNIADMITSLIHILRYNLSQRKATSLKEELETIKHYTNIQKYRYGNSFNIVYNVSPETDDCNILRFILQPIVENSIFHGFSELTYTGEILINSYIENSNLIIEIHDNGIGFKCKSDILKKGEKQSKSDKKFSGIGLNNIQNRIHLYFGKNYGMSFFNNEKNGATVKIVLPHITGNTIVKDILK